MSDDDRHCFLRAASGAHRDARRVVTVQRQFKVRAEQSKGNGRARSQERSNGSSRERPRGQAERGEPPAPFLQDKVRWRYARTKENRLLIKKRQSSYRLYE